MKRQLSAFRSATTSHAYFYLAHIKAMIEFPEPKEGNGKGTTTPLRCLQLTSAVVEMTGYDPSGPFMTLLIKTKLDKSMMFEWQRYTQENSDVPHYAEILEFIDLPTRDSEMAFCECPKCHSQPVHSETNTQVRTAFLASADTACMSYNVGKHPLYSTCAGNLNLHQPSSA